jgi:hypothetical protein
VFWVDVDEATRPKVLKCLVQRREQNVGDSYQLELIQDHWNRVHPGEEPIKLSHDHGPMSHGERQAATSKPQQPSGFSSSERRQRFSQSPLVSLSLAN